MYCRDLAQPCVGIHSFQWEPCNTANEQPHVASIDNNGWSLGAKKPGAVAIRWLRERLSSKKGLSRWTMWSLSIEVHRHKEAVSQTWMVLRREGKWLPDTSGSTYLLGQCQDWSLQDIAMIPKGVLYGSSDWAILYVRWNWNTGRVAPKRRSRGSLK